jgi:hypothetical protein
MSSIEKPSYEMLMPAVYKLNSVSKFYTVDLAQLINGEWIIVETGDGQVSGLAPNQNPIGLYNSFLKM